MKFLHLADLHLGRSFPYRLEKHRRQNREDRFKLFERAIQYCNEFKIDYLILAGDIIEEDLFTRKDLYRFLDQLNRLKETKVLYLFGNHDFHWGRQLVDMEEIPDHVHLFGSNQMNYFDDDEYRIRFLGQSWDERKYRDVLYLNPADFKEGYEHILIHHGSWNASDYFSLNANDPLLKRFVYVAMGHIHRPFNEGTVYMAGTPEPLDYGDLHVGHAVQGTFDGSWTFESIPLSKRKINSQTINLTDRPSMTEVLKSLKINQEAAPIYYITWTGTLNDRSYIEALEDYLRRQEIEFKSIDQTTKELNLKALQQVHADDLLGRFLEYMNEHPETENYELILELGIQALLGDAYD